MYRSPRDKMVKRAPLDKGTRVVIEDCDTYVIEEEGLLRNGPKQQGLKPRKAKEEKC